MNVGTSGKETPFTREDDGRGRGVAQARINGFGNLRKKGFRERLGGGFSSHRDEAHLVQLLDTDGHRIPHNFTLTFFTLV